MALLRVIYDLARMPKASRAGRHRARPGCSLGVAVLGGTWGVISRVISPLIWVIIIVTLLITPLITAHEPPSRV